MEHSQAIKSIFFLAILALMNLVINIAISHADQVYNFYFNPDGSNQSPIVQQPQQIAEPVTQSEPAPIKPREIAPSSSYLPKEKVEWGDDYSLLRLGLYLFGSFGHKSSSHLGAEGKQLEKSAGGTLALQLFPSKHWGLFGEGITDKDFSKFSFAAGTEIIPIHLSLFGYEDLLALGGELGWSDYKKEVINRNTLNTFSMKWFAGAKTHIKLSEELYADIGLRKSFDAPIWVANAGVSLHF